MTSIEFGEAYQTGITRTTAFLLSRGVPTGAAADIAQTAWMRGWEHLDQLREETVLGPWINAIALNQYRRVLRTRKREQEWKPAYSDLATTRLDLAAIDVSRILEACRPCDRSLLQAQMCGATAKELADHEGVSQTAIRLRLLRARRSARQICRPQPCRQRYSLALT
ncbi:MAG: sigma factor [Acidobacteriota bacterium]